MDRDTLRRNQLSGAAVGAMIGLMTANFWPELRETIGGWLPALLWGAVVGGVLASMTPLGAVAGRITGSENAVLNQIVGLLMLFVLVGLCGLGWRLATNIIVP